MSSPLMGYVSTSKISIIVETNNYIYEKKHSAKTNMTTYSTLAMASIFTSVEAVVTSVLVPVTL